MRVWTGMLLVALILLSGLAAAEPKLPSFDDTRLPRGEGVAPISKTDFLPPVKVTADRGADAFPVFEKGKADLSPFNQVKPAPPPPSTFQR